MLIAVAVICSRPIEPQPSYLNNVVRVIRAVGCVFKGAPIRRRVHCDIVHSLPAEPWQTSDCALIDTHVIKSIFGKHLNLNLAEAEPG